MNWRALTDFAPTSAGTGYASGGDGQGCLSVLFKGLGAFFAIAAFGFAINELSSCAF